MAITGECLICRHLIFTGQRATFDERMKMWFHQDCYSRERIAEKPVVIHPSLNKPDISEIHLGPLR